MAAERQRLKSARERQMDSLRLQYIAAIRDKVERVWTNPGKRGQDLQCSVLVSQIPGGEVVDVRVSECNGDSVFQRSVEQAVRKASPLPAAPDPELFERQLQFVFKPKN